MAPALVPLGWAPLSGLVLVLPSSRSAGGIILVRDAPENSTWVVLQWVGTASIESQSPGTLRSQEAQGMLLQGLS